MTRIRDLALLIGLAPALEACSSSPDQLATKMGQVMESGDQDAALALARLEGAPAQLHFFFLDEVGDCAAADTVCTAQVMPLDEKFAEQSKSLAEQGLEVTTEPEGLIVIESRTANGKGTMRMPYAKVDGDYRIVAQRYTAAKLAEMRDTSNDALLQKMLDQGIYDPASGERRTDWKDDATALPPGGGEPGESFARQVQAMAAAAKAADPEAAVTSGDGLAARMMAATDYDGKPVSLEARKRSLRAQSARMLHEIRIDGGFVKGDDAILMFEGRNGIGWVERGAMFVSRDDDGWGKAGSTTVSYPAN
jgi:hypothetical protein